MSSFSDDSKVALVVEIDRGALRALLDNPMLLHEPDPGSFFHRAVIRGITALKEAKEFPPLKAPLVAEVAADPLSYVHTVIFDRQGFAVTHPLDERMTIMRDCALHQHLTQYGEMPVDREGQYRAIQLDNSSWDFEYVGPAPEPVEYT